MTCITCGNAYDDKLQRCPHCGSPRYVPPLQTPLQQYEPPQEAAPKKKNRALLIVLPIVLGVLLAGAGVFAWLYFSGRLTEDKTHCYAVFNGAAEWETAKEECEQMGGHLLTINSEEEQKQIEELLTSSGTPDVDLWIGFRKDWNEWITGEAVTYTNWGSGEPDAWDGQCYGAICNGNRSGGGYYIQRGQWDDLKNGQNYGGYYICEWESKKAYEAYLNR